MKKNKLLSVLLAITLIIAMLSSVTAGAANTNTTTTITKAATNGQTCEITCRVTDTWDNNKNVEITVTNTGNINLEGWAIKFDGTGEVQNLWGAAIYDRDDTSYILEGAPYGSVIRPGYSATLGFKYVTANPEDKPENVTFSSDRVEKTDGYNVTVVKTGGWDTESTVNVTVSNTTDKPIRLWDLTFTANFEIREIWNAVQSENQGNTYKVKYSDNTMIIAPNSSVTFGMRSSRVETPTITDVHLTEVIADVTANDSANDIELTSDQQEIPVSAGNQLVYFYATTELDVDSIDLLDASSNESVGVMVDDGNYTVSGDDMAGDGVYSCKVSIDTSDENNFAFVAKYIDGSKQVVSNTVEIYVYAELTDTELDDMDEVDDVLQTWRESADFASLSIEEKQQQTQAILINLAQNGTENKPYSLIAQDSIIYNAETKMFSFSYSCGILGGIMLVDFGDEYNGSGNSQNAAPPTHTLPALPTDLPDDAGSALIMYAFDDTTPTNRYPYYTQMETDWENIGLDTTIDTDVTVEDFKTNMDSNKIIVFAMHGSYYSYNYGFLWLQTATMPALCTREIQTADKNKEYSADLKQHRIAKVNNTYWVLPSLFTNTYASNELNDSVIFMENCCGYGEKGNVDNSLASALVDSGVETVVGFHNSVYAVYSRDMMNTFVTNMLSGMTAREALNNCISTFGEDDAIWYNNQGFSGSPHSDKAYPILYGNENETLWNVGVQNGSFEKGILSIINWDKVGDVRKLKKLGELNPWDGDYMAIITTGIGSAEDSYLSGTEGSIISQTFQIPKGSTTLSFSYNVISEEPMEYVGSRYDDKFYVKIFDAKNTEVLMAASESVNSSTWYAVDGIDFDGGDNTAYQTLWKTVTIDVSACAGSFITLKFGVYDVGDSIYDTAALIDNVVLQ